jgi:hypothetical protein
MVTKALQYTHFFDDLLKYMNYKEPESSKTTDAEIMTLFHVR